MSPALIEMIKVRCTSEEHTNRKELLGTSGISSRATELKGSGLFGLTSPGLEFKLIADISVNISLTGKGA